MSHFPNIMSSELIRDYTHITKECSLKRASYACLLNMFLKTIKVCS